MSGVQVTKGDYGLYLKEARSWETDRVIQAEKSRRVAWRIAAVSAVVSLVSVLAVVMLTPLKSVEPFVIRVDNATGIVDAVSGLDDAKENYSEAINKYFTQWYVRYREGYSKELAESYYHNTGLMSVSVEQQRYHQFFNPKSPSSPLNVYGDHARVNIRIKSTSFINPNVALVRYTREIARGSDRPAVSHWAATITFRYSSAPMSVQDRGINPLGFQVMEYRNDPDTGVSEKESPVQAPVPSLPNRQPESRTQGVTLHPVVPAISQ